MCCHSLGWNHWQRVDAESTAQYSGEYYAGRENPVFL